jgi:hypothetical protein
MEHPYDSGLHLCEYAGPRHDAGGGGGYSEISSSESLLFRKSVNAGQAQSVSRRKLNGRNECLAETQTWFPFLVLFPEARLIEFWYDYFSNWKHLRGREM